MATLASAIAPKTLISTPKIGSSCRQQCFSSFFIRPVIAKKCQIGVSQIRFKASRKQIARASPIVLASTADRPITFQIGEASLTVPFSESQAQDLDKAIDSLLQTFREKEKATRPQRWQSMEYRVAGDITAGEIFLEIFCNPNAYSSAFQARALVTVKDERIRFTSEGALSALKAAVDEYLGRV